MCGRTVCHLAPDDIQSACTYKDKHGKKQRPEWRDATNGKKYYPSYNIAPGAHTPVLLSGAHFNNSRESRVIQPMMWGLIPSWHKGSIGNKSYETNNCRAESMMEKQTYRVPLQKGRRCVILAEGFYEWKRDKTAKQPYFIYFPRKSTSNSSVDVKTEHDISDTKHEAKLHTVNCEYDADQTTEEKSVDDAVSVKTEPLDETAEKVKEEPSERIENTNNNTDNVDGAAHHLLTMAGVFDVWQPEDGTEPVYSYSVITVESSTAMAWLHHRMPAILSTDEEIEEWLNFGEFPFTKAVKLIQPTMNIELHPVSTYVNNARNNSPDCVKKVDLSKPKTNASSNMMMTWLSKGPSPSKSQTQNSGSKPVTVIKKKASNTMMMNWLTKGKSPIKTEGKSPIKTEGKSPTKTEGKSPTKTEGKSPTKTEAPDCKRMKFS